MRLTRALSVLPAAVVAAGGIFSLSLFGAGVARLRVSVRNDLPVSRTSETVEIAAAELVALGGGDLSRVHVFEQDSGNEVLAQALDLNNDGCDPESCRGVLIEDCLFDAGDDCIALKSGRNADGRRLNVPVEDVVIRRCEMKAGHGGITIGSECSGGARNIYAEHCHLDSPDLERGLRLKTNAARGGVIENVFVRDIEIGSVKLAPIEIDLRYDNESGTALPSVRNVVVERMQSAHSRHALYLRGLEAAPMRGIVIRDCAFRGVAEPSVIEGAIDLTLTRLTVEAAKGEDQP